MIATAHPHTNEGSISCHLVRYTVQWGTRQMNGLIDSLMFSNKIMGKKAFIMHVTMQHDQVGGKGDELFFLRTKTVHEWIDIYRNLIICARDIYAVIWKIIKDMTPSLRNIEILYWKLICRQLKRKVSFSRQYENTNLYCFFFFRNS